MKVSVIDLGFNSVKLVNYIVESDNSFRIEAKHSVKARLGQGLNEKGLLNAESINRVIEVLDLFRDIINLKSVNHVLPIATSAVREAYNKKDFLSMVCERAGFQFRVLSEEEEALYSYLGAVKATCYPDTLFFDLGGGSLEIVSTKGYRIKRIMSLPLGALRLSEKFDKRKVTGLEKEILQTLPDRLDLVIGKETKLVGVGGSIRAIARYDQKLRKYPLNILHNYVIDYSSIGLVRKKLSKMNSSEIANIDAIGSNRAFSVTAASIVIDAIMRKLEFEKVVVSTHGLREGYLMKYLNNMNTRFVRPNAKHIQKYVKDKCKPELVSNRTGKFVQTLISFGMMKKVEYEIFMHAKKKLAGQFMDFWEADIIFSHVMNDIFARLNHEEQLILALSLIFRKKPKTAEELSSLYDTLLQHQHKKSIQKIAVCIDLTEIFERYKSHVRLTKNSADGLRMIIVTRTNYFPEHILNNMIKIFESVFDIELTCTVSIPRKPTNQAQKIFV